MVKLTKDNFDETISEGRVLIDFSAIWCGYCRIMTPVVEEIASHYSDTIKVFAVDVDKDEDIATRYDVEAFPTYILFENGIEINRHTGASSSEELEDMLTQWLHAAHVSQSP